MKIVGGLALALLVSLTACGQEQDDIRLQEISCPAVAVPSYARDLVEWQGGGHDLTNLAYRVRIADAQGSCTRPNEGNNLSANITVTLQATRGPAMAGRNVEAGYFVAVLRNGQIIDKQVYNLSGVFPSNTDQITISGKPVTMTLPISQKLDGADYTIATGMQLTQAQIDDNQAAGRR